MDKTTFNVVRPLLKTNLCIQSIEETETTGYKGLFFLVSDSRYCPGISIEVAASLKGAWLRKQRVKRRSGTLSLYSTAYGVMNLHRECYWDSGARNGPISYRQS